MLQNPFQARSSKISPRHWDSQVSSSVLHSRALTDLQIHKPLNLINDTPRYGSSSFTRASKIDNPFYSPRSTLEEKYQSKRKMENPFLMVTPHRYQPIDVSLYRDQGLSSWQRQVYLQRVNQQSESPGPGVYREVKEQINEVRPVYSFQRDGRQIEEDFRDTDRYTRQIVEASRQLGQRTDPPKISNNIQKAPTIRKDSLQLDSNPQPAESTGLRAKFMEHDRKMSNNPPDSPRGWPREQYTTMRPAVSSQQNGFKRAEWSRTQPKDTKYIEGSSIINKLQNIPESRETNSLEPNIRMTDSKVYEYKGEEGREFQIPQADAYEAFDFNSARLNELPEIKKELYETSKFKVNAEREIPSSIKYKNTVFERVATY